MMQLSEEKTYRTCDGSRRGIRLEKATCSTFIERGKLGNGFAWYADSGRRVGVDCGSFGDYATALIEELSADPRPFSYADCPMGEDGRRRAVTRDGWVVVLLCDDAPGTAPIVGISKDDVLRWRNDGTTILGSGDYDLLVPPPPKRVVWVNLLDNGKAEHWSTEFTANDMARSSEAHGHVRLGNRAYPIEIDGP